MRDVFFTILAVWIVYRIWNAVQLSSARSAANERETKKREGSVSVDYVPPKKKGPGDDDGEYVDYEEVK